jgi:hypothetical protein
MTIQNIWQEYTPEHEVARSNRAGWAIHSFIKYQSDNNLIIEK